MIHRHNLHRRASVGNPRSACPAKIPKSVKSPDRCVDRMVEPLKAATIAFCSPVAPQVKNTPATHP